MTSMRTKLIVAVLALTLVVAFLASAGVRKGWVYYMDVDAFLADADHHNQRVRLNGHVTDDPAAIRTEGLVTHFALRGESGALEVEYRGVLPEMFQAGVQVVAEGRLDNAGVFHADTLMTKCASKYEAEPGATPPHPVGKGSAGSENAS